MRSNRLIIQPFSIYLFLLVASVSVAIAYPVASFAMYLYYACVASGFLSLLLSQQGLKLDRTSAIVVSSCLLSILYFFVSYLLSDRSIETSYGRFIAIEIISANVLIISIYKNSCIDKNKLQKYMYVFTIAAILSTFIAFDRNILLMSMTRLVRLNSGIINGNMYAMGMTIIALFLIHDIVSTKKARLLKGVLLIAVLFLLTLPYSRTALVSLFAGIALYFYLLSPKNKKMTRVLQITLGLAVLLYLMSLFESTSAVLDRIATLWQRNDTVVATSDQSRWNLIRLGIDGWKEKPLFGQGFNSFGKHSSIVTGYSTYAHNNFAEILYNTGAVGLILNYLPKIVLVIDLFRQIRKNQPKRLDCALLSMMVVLLMYDMAVVSYYYLSLNYIWIFAASYILNRNTL